MQQPEGIDDGSGHVFRLIRPIYELKQSGNIWNEEISSTMIELKFLQLKTDYCCFIQHKNEDFTILIVWVDDILSFSLTNSRNDCIEQELKTKFEVNSIGNPNMILGIKFTQKENYISLSQAHFVETLLQKFGLEMRMQYQHLLIQTLIWTPRKPLRMKTNQMEKFPTLMQHLLVL